MEKARQLLSEAGWEDNDRDGIREKKVNGVQKKLIFNITINSKSTTDKSLALTFQNQSKKVGIKINIISKAFNLALNDFNNGDYELLPIVLRQSPSLDDLYNNWHSASIGRHGRNLLRFSHPEIDNICEEIRKTPFKKKRDDYYRRFQEIIYEEQAAIYFYSFKERIIVSKSIVASPTILRPGYQENTFYKK